MLRHLHIQNYALISHLDIDFNGGFSAITGETGAGKSIILGALGLVLGARADTKTITEGEERCVIEAEFDDYLIRRELNINGRSRSLVNDEVVTQAELKALAAKLIDIHSQHESLLIANDDFQLGIVDAIADNATERAEYEKHYSALQAAKSELQQLTDTISKSEKDRDYLTFQYEQLMDANLSDPNELEALEDEEYSLSHVEERKAHLTAALQAIDNDEMSALSLIHSAVGELQEVADLGERLRSLEIELKDIASEADRLAENTEYNPERMQQVVDRLDEINTLLRKHGKQNIAELMAYRDEIGVQLSKIESFDDELLRLKAEVSKHEAAATKAAEALSQTRRKVVKPICERLVKDLSSLAIAHAKVDIAITDAPTLLPQGKDMVQFMFAANLNQSLRAVSEVASGGEISRLMLCIKALIASSNGLPTIIFDEIDTGVSGETATQMGRIMCQMAESRQIIAITHLPQIAAQATTQYRVYKADTDRRTETNIQRLNDAERVNEIAGMLAGKQITPAAIDTAKQLLNN